MKRQAKLSPIFLALTLWLLALHCNGAAKQDNAQNNAQEKLIEAQGFHAFATIDGSNISAAFGTLSNTSEQPIALQKVVIKGEIKGIAELHQTSNDNGVMKMLKVDSITIPAKQSVELAPGGLHIMLINLPKPLEVGKTIALELAFDNGTTLKIEAPIKARNIRERVINKSGKHTHH